VISDQKFREYIKEVASLSGINEPIIKVKQIGNQTEEILTTRNNRISTHTARRTFITIMKNMKVPDAIIMKITGHKSMSSFNMYYRPTTEDVGSELKRVFDKEESNE
jgi:integrase